MIDGYAQLCVVLNPAIVLEFTSIRIGEKLYTYRDIKKTTVPSSGLSLTKVEVSKDTKNEDLEKLMLKAKETIDAAMPSGKNYANMKDAAADYTKAIEALTAYIKTEFTDKGLSKNTITLGENEKPIKPYPTYSSTFVKFEKTTSATFPTKVLKVSSNKEDAFTQDAVTEADKKLEELSKVERKSYIPYL